MKTVVLGNGDPNSDKFKPTEAVKIHIWDTAGQERFRHIARMFYNEVNGVFICFDLTDEEEAFNKVKFWLDDLEKNAPNNAVKILCGLKLDLI